MLLAMLGCLCMSVQAMTVADSIAAPAGVSLEELVADTTAESTALRYNYFFLEAMLQRQKGNNASAFDLLQHCLDINPQAPEAYYYLAQYYQALKDKDKAMAYVKRAAGLNPDDPTIMETLAQLYIGNEDYAEATATLEQLYSHSHNREDLLETLYQLYQQQKRWDEAIGALEELEKINGKSERLSFAKSDTYTQMGNKEAAVAEVEALAKKYPNDLNYLGKYGDLLLMNDREDEALNVYNRILSEEPDNVRAQASMLAYYRLQEDSVACDSVLERMLLNRNASTEQKIYLLRQKISESEDAGGDSTQVLALFHKLLALPDADTNIGLLCANYMELKKMPEDSIRLVLEGVLQRAPDNALARLKLVGQAWDDKNLDRVVSLCQEARLYTPEEMAFYYYQGMAYYQQDEKDKALGAFQNGLGVITEDSNPDIVSDFYAIMGDLLHQKGRQREAFEAYDSCLHWKPDNIMCLNNYAYYLSELNQDLERAEKMSQTTVTNDPKNPTYLDTYAWILFMQKRYAEALVYIETALKNDSDHHAVITEHAGDIYAMNHDTARALELWQEALGKSPERKVLIRKIKLKKYIKE